MRPLFPPGQTTAVLRPDFESEAYFGAGWSDAVRTPTGPVRRVEDRGTLFLPLEPGHDYRLLLALAPEARNVDVAFNDRHVGVCNPQSARACELTLPSFAIPNGVSTITLSSPRGAEPRGVALTFYGARISYRR
jgi:hypothetical protein